MFNLDSLLHRRKQLEQDIDQLQKIVDAAPDGHLISRRRNDKYEYSLSLTIDGAGRRELYIPRVDWLIQYFLL